MMAAPICTVGPSRPIDAPQASPISVSPILAIATRAESTRFWCSGSMCSAAIACGMPLPCAPWK